MAQTQAEPSTDSTTIDPDEVARFQRQAREWWDEDGPFRPLHGINPVRLGFIRERLVAHFARDRHDLAPFAGLTLLDIGCGGGIVSEPMARLGFAVTGLDADTTAVAVARAHAEAGGLAIAYRQGAAETVAAEGQRFDVVLALEVAEHAEDQPLFLATCARLVRPGGALILSTLNRTAWSFLMAIVGAEYVLRWVPRGTHRWGKFLRPAEIAAVLRREGMVLKGLEGLVIDPRTGGWRLGDNLMNNYLLFAIKQE
jgi:2-polyprenyl-6-hydroxyphenyl methylase / 3-demethylubiquinone-9 3-methyltransferase